MTNAGWYPDPAGAPDTFRYWDGQAWSQMTTTQPSGGARPAESPASPPPAAPTQYGAVPTPPPPPAAPGPYAPQPPPPGQGGYAGYGGSGGYGGYGQPQQWSPTPGAGGSGGGNKTIVIVIAAVVALVLLGVGGFFGVRALVGDDGDRQADDDSSQGQRSDESGEPGPSEESSSTVEPTGIQCTGGSPAPSEDPAPAAPQLTGGGLSIPRQASYELATGDQVAFAFADAFVLQYTNVEEKWISLTGVGGLPRANGFDDVATAAEIVMQCLTGSDSVYRGFTGRTDKTNEAITVDGKPAHRITAEVRVTDPEITVEGDLTDVVVVDTGDPAAYGLYIGMAALGHDDLISANEAVIGEIKVG
ncbi:DUF2510 domain-containing protein [Nocardioides albidus]|uniref:DUF2510 domain-containing protein n=1 Tax=Nocardioides albidus TaxID=1517589 RepID=A0A5C4VS56_9ACTN|nr:DUF2510 domain-containing protein [Nocardioides albidus]TNM38640.1 DUF2510 domain-containing protein [Nocardioides albidus]